MIYALDVKGTRLILIFPVQDCCRGKRENLSAARSHRRWLSVAKENVMRVVKH